MFRSIDRLSAVPQASATPSLSSIFPLNSTLDWFCLLAEIQRLSGRDLSPGLLADVYLGNGSYKTRMVQAFRVDINFANLLQPETLISLVNESWVWILCCLSGAGVVSMKLCECTPSLQFQHREGVKRHGWFPHRPPYMRHAPLSISDRGCLAISRLGSAWYWQERWPELVPKHRSYRLISLLIETPSPSWSLRPRCWLKLLLGACWAMRCALYLEIFCVSVRFPPDHNRDWALSMC